MVLEKKPLEEAVFVLPSKWHKAVKKNFVDDFDVEAIGHIVHKFYKEH